MTIGIYKIRNTVNGKIYIGSSIHCETRINEHKNDLITGIHSNGYLQNSFNKYGVNAFEYIIIEQCNEDMLLIREDAWIKYYNSMDRKFGYNLRSADRKTISQETRNKLRLAGLGKKLTPESIAKRTAKQTGRKLTEEHKIKISEAKKGVKHSAEWTFNNTKAQRDRSTLKRQLESENKFLIKELQEFNHVKN